MPKDPFWGVWDDLEFGQGFITKDKRLYLKCPMWDHRDLHVMCILGVELR